QRKIQWGRPPAGFPAQMVGSAEAKSFAKKNIKKTLLFVLFFIISCMGTAFAGDVTFLTPQTYTRTTQKPLTHSHTFAIPANYRASSNE
ncbi:MAG: hypothetical protein KAW12_07790, partial [Candidatus Aminicenantes bacterium]|nr:hypothetical protein [Candidatus Aminicenantes bacterium]